MPADAAPRAAAPPRPAAPPAPRPHVIVAVLGDLGRSPRMQYHALALARHADVTLIGTAGSAPDAAVRDSPTIRIRMLADTPLAPGRARLARAGWRAVGQAVQLAGALLAGPAPQAIIVQTPPALPTLAVAALAARARGARLIVDWHNLGHALLALQLGARHPVVRATAALERLLGRRAAAHLCVSAALRDALARWGIAAVVLPDRPARRFTPLAAAERDRRAAALAARCGWEAAQRPALVFCASSWTADDDFDLLLAALPACDARLAAVPSFPGLLLLLTGRGARRDAIAARVAALRLRCIRVHLAWFPAEEYPDALAAADLGLSLHRGAAGVDLPMKIADCLGAGVPVCALDYGDCLREQVVPGGDAHLFRDAAGLAAALVALLAGFPAATPALDRLRAGARAAAAGPRWEDTWQTHAAAPVLGPERAR